MVVLSNRNEVNNMYAERIVRRGVEMIRYDLEALDAANVIITNEFDILKTVSDPLKSEIRSALQHCLLSVLVALSSVTMMRRYGVALSKELYKHPTTEWNSVIDIVFADVVKNKLGETTNDEN